MKTVKTTGATEQIAFESTSHEWKKTRSSSSRPINGGIGVGDRYGGGSIGYEGHGEYQRGFAPGGLGTGQPKGKKLADS